MAKRRKSKPQDQHEEQQRTEKGTEIPIPTRRQFFGDLGKALKKKSPVESPEEPSERDPGKR